MRAKARTEPRGCAHHHSSVTCEASESITEPGGRQAKWYTGQDRRVTRARERGCVWGSWLTCGARRSSPRAPAMPAPSQHTPPPHTPRHTGPEQQRLREQEEEAGEGLPLRRRLRRTPCSARRPGAHSLDELQPLLDVRLPSLPLHQSLGERTVHQSVSRGRAHLPPATDSPSLIPFLRSRGEVPRAVTSLRASKD